MENCIDIFSTQDYSLKKVVNNLPPSSTSAKKLFEKWLESSYCEDWYIAWEYLSSLALKDYLRMYAELPALLIKKIPVPNSPEHELLTDYKYRYQAIAIWLHQLTSYDTANNANIYNSQELGTYRHEANIVVANLDLCRAIIRHPKSKLSSIFYTPTYLWFWSEVANCIKYFKATGLLEPIDIKEIKTKRQENKEWGQQLSFYEDNLNHVSTKVCNDWREFLENIPAILPSASQDLLKIKSDAMLENALNSYLKAQHSLRHVVKHSDLYQKKTICKDKTRGSKLFITGAKQKRPKC